MRFNAGGGYIAVNNDIGFFGQLVEPASNSGGSVLAMGIGGQEENECQQEIPA
jgi:hypothetical protein